MLPTRGLGGPGLLTTAGLGFMQLAVVAVRKIKRIGLLVDPNQLINRY